jgi:hypothetical protein
MEDAQTPQGNSGLQHGRFNEGLDQAEEAASVENMILLNNRSPFLP